MAWLLVALLVPGCAGPAKEGPSGLVDTDSAVEVGPDGAPLPPPVVGGQQVAPPAAEFATLVGNVSSDSGLLLRNVLVLLVGPGLQTRTDDQGAFAFENITPAKVIVRVEASGFNVYERELSLAAGKIARHTVILVALDNAGAGYVPHIHDYWKGRTEVTIIDQEYEIWKLRANSNPSSSYPQYNEISNQVMGANLASSGTVYRLPPPVGTPEDETQPPLVYPGANRVEVTFTWNDAAPNLPHIVFAYEPANATQRITLEKHASGVPWSIDVTPAMTDNGHQVFTLWNFFAQLVNHPQAPDYRPATNQDPIRVTIKVFKGTDAPAEPPHPTFWSNGTKRIIRDADDEAFTIGANVWSFYGFSLRGAANIVPPGTKWLELDLYWAYTDALSTTPANRAIDPKYVIYYNPGNHHWDTFTSEFKLAPRLDEPVPGHLRFNITLQPGEADAYYQLKSLWNFRVRNQDNPSGLDGIPFDAYRSRSHQLFVTAVKDPALEIR